MTRFAAVELARGARFRVASRERGARLRRRATPTRLTPFPRDYAELERQARESVKRCAKDGVELVELQFPPGGLELASGDLEGNVECNLTTERLRGICDAFVANGTASTTRVLFPDPTEMRLATTGANAAPDGIRAPEQSDTRGWFADWKGTLDYVDDPSFMSVSGFDKIFGGKKNISERMRGDETAYVVAYPSANISELANTRDLYEGCVRGRGKSLVVCNGELERTRSNYYPPFWNAGEMGPLRSFCRKFEGAYVIYNFKGSNPAVLFRVYPEPWQVFRRRKGGRDGLETLERVCTFEKFESVKSVALDVLPRYP
jgi:hypothetical protein